MNATLELCLNINWLYQIRVLLLTVYCISKLTVHQHNIHVNDRWIQLRILRCILSTNLSYFLRLISPNKAVGNMLCWKSFLTTHFDTINAMLFVVKDAYAFNVLSMLWCPVGHVDIFSILCYINNFPKSSGEQKWRQKRAPFIFIRMYRTLTKMEATYICSQCKVLCLGMLIIIANTFCWNADGLLSPCFSFPSLLW